MDGGRVATLLEKWAFSPRIALRPPLRLAPPPANGLTFWSELPRTNSTAAAPRLYDPSDPQTFPTSSASRYPSSSASRYPSSSTTRYLTPVTSLSTQSPGSYRTARSPLSGYPQSSYAAPTITSALTDPSQAFTVSGPPAHVTFSGPTVPAVDPSLPQPDAEPLYTAANPFSMSSPSVDDSDDLPYAESLPKRTAPLPFPNTMGNANRFRHWRSWFRRLKSMTILAFVFILIKIPSQTYLFLLLRLPSLYFSRVSRLFEDANLSLPDIQRMAVINGDQFSVVSWTPDASDLPPRLRRFNLSWEAFIDALLREWKTQNVISALMLSAILTMLQIDAAAADPIARMTALISLVCALMSLLFGSLYIIRFGTMRKMYKAASWADEAQRGSASLLWNVWVLLALPAVWLAWSIILFVTCIMAFTWRTGAVDDNTPMLVPHTALALRIGVSAVLLLALIYLLLIIDTFKRYGDTMDARWKEKVARWTSESRSSTLKASYKSEDSPVANWIRSSVLPPDSQPVTELYSSLTPVREESVPDQPQNEPPSNPLTISPFLFHNNSSEATIASFSPFPAVKIIRLSRESWFVWPIPPVLADRGMAKQDWTQLVGTLNNHKRQIFESDGSASLHPLLSSLNQWNRTYFAPHSTEAVLCIEEPLESGTWSYSVQILHLGSGAFDTQYLPVLDELRQRSIRVIRLHDSHPEEGFHTTEIKIQPQSTSSRSQPDLPHTSVPNTALTVISRNSVQYTEGGEVVDPDYVPNYLTIPLPPSRPPSYLESRDS
ncbi:hypothetical protein MVEN_01762000 [Mycena venus]|uniref:Transmembrane protein n=1 Tax=Mycena venus TaxID=2733690 RepID=A0A8H6XMU3_9AGAR|nr:hypothetical protein MVEN_01762000 [Mycena venus]